VVVRDLLASHRHNTIVCADLDAGRADALVASLSSRRVTAATADVTVPKEIEIRILAVAGEIRMSPPRRSPSPT
jgi:hypothetical protein